MIEMMTIERMRELLQGKNIRKLSRASGVEYRTLLNIASGKNTNPTYLTFKKIEFILMVEGCE